MALTKTVIIDSINILSDGRTQVREATIIKEDGEEIAKTYHRYIIEPGNDLNLQDARIKTALTGIHTPTVISDFVAAKAARQAQL